MQSTVLNKAGIFWRETLQTHTCTLLKAFPKLVVRAERTHTHTRAPLNNQMTSQIIPVEAIEASQWQEEKSLHKFKENAPEAQIQRFLSVKYQLRLIDNFFMSTREMDVIDLCSKYVDKLMLFDGSCTFRQHFRFACKMMIIEMYSSWIEQLMTKMFQTSTHDRSLTIDLVDMLTNISLCRSLSERSYQIDCLLNFLNNEIEQGSARAVMTLHYEADILEQAKSSIEDTMNKDVENDCRQRVHVVQNVVERFKKVYTSNSWPLLKDPCLYSLKIYCMSDLRAFSNQFNFLRFVKKNGSYIIQRLDSAINRVFSEIGNIQCKRTSSSCVKILECMST